MQHILLGKLPITIVNPKILHNILRNISLCLPENYELAAGTRFENIYSYYELIKVAVVGSLHNVKLIMYVPIKTANQHFTVYRIIGLPNRIGKDKFVLYQIDFPYFAIGSSQRDYALLTDTELQRCTTSTVTVCPVSTAFYDIQTATCPLSLYFQTAAEPKPCRKTILLNHDIPVLRRYDTVWIFHFPQPTQVNIRCPRSGKEWETRTEVLHDAGIIHDATSCFITSNKIRTLPELHRVMHTRLDNPSIYMPD